MYAYKCQTIQSIYCWFPKVSTQNILAINHTLTDSIIVSMTYYLHEIYNFAGCFFTSFFYSYKYLTNNLKCQILADSWHAYHGRPEAGAGSTRKFHAWKIYRLDSLQCWFLQKEKNRCHQRRFTGSKNVPKCVCGRGSSPDPAAWGAYSALHSHTLCTRYIGSLYLSLTPKFKT